VSKHPVTIACKKTVAKRTIANTTLRGGSPVRVCVFLLQKTRTFART
jgi:hypothetical protein